MVQATYIKTIINKLKKDGFEIKKGKINDSEVIIAYGKKGAALLTQMNSFVIIGHANKISKELIERFSSSSFEYAVENNKGLPRGLQSGIVSYSLLVSSHIDKAAIDFVEKNPKKHWAAFELPLLYDIKENKLYYFQETPIWGFLMYRGFRKQIEHLERLCK